MAAPAITVRNHQRRVRLDLPWLRRFAAVAIEECVRVSGDERFALAQLEEVSVAIVSDRRIAEIHVEFMDIAGPTDVITFGHGDVVISAETAQTYAAQYQQPVDHEVALYIIHGLLHLNGFDDLEPRAHRRMHGVQARVMRACLRRLRAG
ncbi:MAG: rRNA maturation RNase YbeY [Chthoniobacteraceae bacterium]